MKATITIALFLFLLTGIHAHAQVTLTTKAPETVTVGETFTVRYTLNADAGKAKTSLAGANGFDISYGPAISRTSNITRIEGKETTEQSTTFSYTLQAKKRGKMGIPRLTVNVANNSYRSEALQIQVLGDEKGQNGKPTNKTTQAPTSARGDLFIRIEPARQSVYINEGLLISIKLYSQHAISGFGKMTFPSFDGFAVEAIKVSNQKMTQEQYQGKKYHTAVIGQYLLFPREAGAIEITSGNYEIIALKKQKENKSDDFFKSERYTSDTLKIGNLPVSVTALPLPDNYAGNPILVTGHFQLKASVDKMNIIEGESVRLAVHISGNGNAKLIPIPSIPSADFRVLSQQISDSTDVSAKGISGSRIIHYILMPTRTGALRIHIPELICFDPQSKSYLITDSFDIPISVITSTEEAAGETEMLEGEKGICLQTFLNEDNRKILFYTAFALLILLVCCLVAFRK